MAGKSICVAADAAAALLELRNLLTSEWTTSLAIVAFRLFSHTANCDCSTIEPELSFAPVARHFHAFASMQAQQDLNVALAQGV